MNKCAVSIFLFVSLFLSLNFSVGAVTINSVTVSDFDNFYSGSGGNSVVHLLVNISNVNEAAGNVVSVSADFSGLDVTCAGSGPIITLAPQPGNTWAGICDVSSEAGNLAPNTFKSKPIWVKANETYGNTSDVNSDLVLSLYNIGIPAPIGNCYRFGDGSTNFNDITNFNNIDSITLIIDAKDDSQCVSPGRPWVNGDLLWLKVAKLQFNNINFNNNAADAQKLINLSSIVKLKFSSSKTFQNTRLSVDTTQLPELNNNPFNVWLYHLSFISPQNSFIVSDNGVQAEVINWTSNGYEAMFDEITYNLAFTVNQGFKGYTVTDNVPPAITINSPSGGQIFNTTDILINVTVNGTGTGVSRVVFSVNNASNDATCTVVTPEVSNCVLQLNKNDGYYNLIVSAYDFGNASGNVASVNKSFTVQTSAPTLVVRSPTNDATYTATTGSMLKINFTTSDGNGIGSCGYTLSGPINLNEASISNCTGDVIVQLYLPDGDYNLFLFSKDTLNKMNSTNISFSVTDIVPPLIANNTRLSKSNNMSLSILTDEKATCKYSLSNVTFEKMKDVFTDNVLTHSASVTLSEKGKLYTYYIRCSDLSGNVNKDSFKIDMYFGDLINMTTAVVANLTKPDPSEELELKLLSAGKNTIMFDKSTNPVELITLVTNDVSSNVIIKIVTVSTPSTIYSEKVYKYFSIEHAALRDSKIEGANITFRVEKSWLNSNNIDKTDIVLARYSDSWIPLNTAMTREDNTYVYYTAISPGLSLFAIYRQVAPETVVLPVVTGNTTNVITGTNGNNATSDNLTLLNKRNYNWWIVILIAIVVFAIVMFIVMINKNDRKNPPIFAEDRTMFGRVRRLFK